MADVIKVKASDGTIYDINDVNDYTKDETDALLAGKADVGDSYTKAEEDALLADKADTSSVESALALKANVVDVYSKTEADNLLAGKADVGVSYTKSEDDALLGNKANSADVYTITQTDALLAGKAGVDDSSTTATMATWSADKLNVEFQGKADVGDSYTKAEDDALLADNQDNLGYVEVLGDGVKTLSALVLELYAACDVSKISARSVVECQINSDTYVYQRAYNLSYHMDGVANIGTGTTPGTHQLVLDTGNCKYYRTNGNTTDDGSAVILSGKYVRLYY